DKQSEHEIDGLTVVRVVVDRVLQAHEGTDALRYAGDAAMRNRYAVAKAGTAELLATDEAVEDVAGGERGAPGEQSREVLEDFLLAVERCAGDDSIGGEDFGKLHVVFSFPQSKGPGRRFRARNFTWLV